MLRFVVFEHSADGSSSRLHPAWPLRHACAFGNDDVPVQAEIRAEPGEIVCETRGNESTGLSLQFPVDPVSDDAGASSPVSSGSSLGLITLQTCLLPQRERPYLLSLELARHRLMLVLNKMEDWALFDVAPDDPAMALFERARRAFTDALVLAARTQAEGEFSAEADRLSRRALSMALEAGERITLWHATRQFARRSSGELAAAAAKIATPANALTEHESAQSRNALIGNVGVILPTQAQVGVSVNPTNFGPALAKAVTLSADFLCMPMRWIDMEPTEGKYLFGTTDRWIEWAVRTARLPIVGGPLVELRRDCVPDWLYIWEHDYETLRELVYEHVKNLVTRYRRTVGTWTVCSGLHVAGNFALSFEQVMDLTRLAVMVVRKLQPSAKVQVQIDQPWGEYVAKSSRSIPPLMYAEMVLQAGINPDLLALRVEMGQPEPGQSTRDMTAFSALLDRYAALERPLAVSAISVPSRGPDPESLGLNGEMDPGYYRQAWSAQGQVDWMTRAMAIAAAKPFVHSVCWHELYDVAPPAGVAGATGKPAGEMTYDGLIDASGEAKPALWRLAEIRQSIRAKKSPLTLPERPAAQTLQ